MDKPDIIFKILINLKVCNALTMLRHTHFYTLKLKHYVKLVDISKTANIVDYMQLVVE